MSSVFNRKPGSWREALFFFFIIPPVLLKLEA